MEGQVERLISCLALQEPRAWRVRYCTKQPILRVKQGLLTKQGLLLEFFALCRDNIRYEKSCKIGSVLSLGSPFGAVLWACERPGVQVFE